MRNSLLTCDVTDKGRVDLDRVSLFPEKTWKNRRNGLRADLVTSDHPEDENSFAEPDRVTPREERVKLEGPGFDRAFAPHSLTILRVKAKG